jgi:hypothetical protein
MGKHNKGSTLVTNGNMGMPKTNPSKVTNKAEDISKSSSGSPDQKGTVPSVGIGSVAQHHSILRIGPRLRAEGLMVPPASDAATLRRQVAALQVDLEAHIEGEQRLQKINQQLRERYDILLKLNVRLKKYISLSRFQSLFFFALYAFIWHHLLFYK